MHQPSSILPDLGSMPCIHTTLSRLQYHQTYSSLLSQTVPSFPYTFQYAQDFSSFSSHLLRFFKIVYVQISFACKPSILFIYVLSQKFSFMLSNHQNYPFKFSSIIHIYVTYSINFVYVNSMS